MYKFKNVIISNNCELVVIQKIVDEYTVSKFWYYYVILRNIKNVNFI